MKKLTSAISVIVVVLSLLLPTQSQAYREEGNYVMAQAGAGRQNIKSASISEGPVTVTSDSDKKTGAAFRIAEGRRFNHNFAAEIGLSKYSKSEWVVATTGGVSGNVGGHVENKMLSVDIDAIGILPIFATVSLYTKLGVEGVHRKIEASLEIPEGASSVHLDGDNKSNILRPKVAIGMTHEISDHFDIDMMASRLLGKSKNNVHSKGYLPATDFFAIGLVYNMS